MFNLALTQKQENEAREKVLATIEAALKEKFGDLLTVAKNKRVIPYAEGDTECYVNVTVSVVRGKREDDGIPYDPFEEEKAYLEKVGEDTAKKAKKAAEVAEKAAKAEAARKAREEAANKTE